MDGALTVNQILLCSRQDIKDPEEEKEERGQEYTKPFCMSRKDDMCMSAPMA